MARTTKTPTSLARDTAAATTATTTTIDATLVTNGVSLTGAGDGKGTIVLRVSNSAGAAKTCTVAAGEKPGASPLVVSVPAGGEKTVALGESFRYRQANGSYSLDFEAGFTGSLSTYRVAR